MVPALFLPNLLIRPGTNAWIRTYDYRNAEEHTEILREWAQSDAPDGYELPDGERGPDRRSRSLGILPGIECLDLFYAHVFVRFRSLGPLNEKLRFSTILSIIVALLFFFCCDSKLRLIKLSLGRSTKNQGFEGRAMSAALLKSLIALVPAVVVLAGAAVLFVRTKTTYSWLQLLGAGCLVMVVLAHVCEAMHLLPWMQWGMEHSVGHYIDLSSAVLGLTLFPAGYFVYAFRKP